MFDLSNPFFHGLIHWGTVAAIVFIVAWLLSLSAELKQK